MRTPRKGGVKGGERNVGARQSASLFVRGASHRAGAALQPDRAAKARFDDPAGHVRALLQDEEACLARKPHRISVEAAAAGDRRPSRGRPALQGPPRLPVEMHVLEQQAAPLRGPGPGGARRAPPPGPPPCRARTRSRRRRSSRPANGSSSARPSTTVTLRGGSRRPPPRPLAHGGVGLERRDGGAGRVEAELRAGTRADLEHAPACVRSQTSAPAAHGGALERPHDRVVHGGVTAGRG